MNNWEGRLRAIKKDLGGIDNRCKQIQRMSTAVIKSQSDISKLSHNY